MLITEKFKGDETELKFDRAGEPIFTQTSLALDEFYEGAFNSTPFLLMLYEERRVPFAERIRKNAFVEFIKEVFKRYPFVGNFETYLFVLRAIFGQLSEITFQVPSPGVLNIDVNATSNLEFDFMGRDASGAIFQMVDFDGSILTFRGIAGIETEYELELLFSEITPAGISPHVTLTFFERFFFIAEEGAAIDDVIDHLGNQIVFTEVGV